MEDVCGEGSECVYLFQKNQYLTGIIQDRAWMTQLNMSDAYRFYGEGLDETIIEWLDEDV